ncbi:MAG: chemotaxis protein CheW [Myxococcota bacterium]|nr:chemotaxis protein CheW [Myxococcota bacterium]
MSAFTELILARLGGDYLLVPLAAVDRVLPAVRPEASGPGRAPIVSVDAREFIVCFGAALLGAARVVVEPSDQMLLLRGPSPLVLWVSAVEELLQAQIQPLADPGSSMLRGVVQVERRSIPVLDPDALFHSHSPQEVAPHAGS